MDCFYKDGECDCITDSAKETATKLLNCPIFRADVFTDGRFSGCAEKALREAREKFGNNEVFEAFENE